jgi:hypothetical protein
VAELNGKTLVLISAGGLLLLSGLKGSSVSSTLRSWITGHGPTGDFANPVAAAAADVSLDVNTPGASSLQSVASNAAANRAVG